MKFSYLEVFHSLAHSLHLTGALQAQNAGRLGRRIDGSQTDHQILEVQTTETRDRRGKGK